MGDSLLSLSYIDADIDPFSFFVTGDLPIIAKALCLCRLRIASSMVLLACKCRATIWCSFSITLRAFSRKAILLIM